MYGGEFRKPEPFINGSLIDDLIQLTQFHGLHPVFANLTLNTHAIINFQLSVGSENILISQQETHLRQNQRF